MTDRLIPAHSFLSDESGAVTVDWVVLTAALVGLGLAVAGVISTGVEDVSNDIDGELTGIEITTAFGTGGPTTTAFSGRTATDYVAYGQSLAPGNNGAVYAHATQLASDDAPDGFNFDDPLSDPDSGHVIYTSDDGSNYSIGGEVVAIDEYDGTAAYFGA